MKYTHTNFQLPTSKTVILLMNVKLGLFYPLGPSPQGSWGGGYFPEYTSYEGHTYQFSASQLQNCDLTRNGGDSNLQEPPLGGKINLPKSTSYERHTHRFSAS